MVFYKIRNKKDGRFRCAGGEPKWNKSGKVFDSLGSLRLMISNCISYNSYKRNTYKNDFSEWEIVEYEVTEKGTKGVHDILTSEKLMQLLKN